LRAYIIVDLGFGDAGKGLLTDFLVRHLNAGVVVRYNGGAQAGHNVVTPDGRHHTFSQFGAGTFVPNVKTYLSKHVVIHPGGLLLEGDILEGMGVKDPFSRLSVSDQALVITPFHQAANRIRELVRGENRHGSCGVGVGEAVEDSLSHFEDSVFADDLGNPARLKRKLRSIRERKYKQLAELCKDNLSSDSLAREWETFERDDLIDTWVSTISRIGDLGLVVPDAELERWLSGTETVIFEGAQGVLLDAEAGFHPYTTWSRCTTENALDLLSEIAPDSSAFKVGVLRCYAIRHGPGPLPTETNELTPIVLEHNQQNEWQGRVRYGWFDAVLARYALGVTGEMDSLLVTHVDVLSHLDAWKYCQGYKGYDGLDDMSVNTDVSDGVLKNFNLPRSLPLAEQMRFTQALSAVTPALETCDANEGEVIQKIESSIGQAVDMISKGPSAENVQILNSLPS
jgi:adenylosuccinate synthase